MNRLFCLALAATLVSHLPSDAQEKERPKEFTNSIGMKFVWIPPGNFLMGSPLNEERRDRDEFQHKVTLTKGFYLGVYTVTQEQWKEIMGTNPSRLQREKALPVENVSWKDCQLFLEKMSKMESRAYRLPTEAEWEYACRAGTTTPFYCGETISTDQANYDGEYTYGNGKRGVNRRKSTPVGSFPANPWGLYDMHGNVCQWCQDWYGAYPQKDVVDPTGPDTGRARLLRGGSFLASASRVRSAERNYNVPSFRVGLFGFRVAMTFNP